ncbi:isochorismate synthase [Mycetocola reblochoni]
MAGLARQAERTGGSPIVCGLIPFELDRPALLHVTDDAVFTPRSVPPDAEPSAAGGAPLAAAPAPAAVPDSPRYRDIVARAIRAIDAGRLDKVVLARTMDVAAPDDMDADELTRVLLERLAAADPLADVFAARLPDGGTWLGASPEVVADVHDRSFVTHPLAGSRPRSDSSEPAPAFDGVDKDAREHAHVVEHIRDALSPLVEALEVPPTPTVMATDRMWHLGTRITARLRPGVSALEAAVTLHPTPAVCGVPTAAAAEAISRLEDRPRGFYSGLVGWTDADGNGRWSLVLRAALLADGHLTLHAGAGIVAGSDPAEEHAETAAKFGTVLGALKGTR